MPIETLRPVDPDVECNTASENGCSACPDHYTCVDEVVPDDATTMVLQNTDDDVYYRDLYNVEDHSVGIGVINFIKVYAVCRQGGVPDQESLKICHKTGGTVYESAEKMTTINWATYSEQWDTNLQAVRPWSWADIDALSIGVSLRNGSGGVVNITQVTQVYVEVDYSPGWTGKISGVTDPASIMGVPVADIAAVKGVA